MVLVSSDDTDILVLLIHHWNVAMGTVYFCTERKETMIQGEENEELGLKKKDKMKKRPVQMWWEIGNLIEKEKLDGVPILLTHAWSGCDTTSAVHQKGKIKVLQ